MTATTNIPSEIQHFERKLAHEKDDFQRLALIDRMVTHYAFTNIHRAQELLAEMREISENLDQPDFILNYHIHAGFIENQLYNFKRAEFHYLHAIDMLEERGHANQLAETYIDYIGTCMNLHKEAEVNEYLEKTSKLLKAFPDPRLQARLACRHGYLHLHRGFYSKAIEWLLEAEKLLTLPEKSLDLKDYFFITLIYSGLGNVFDQNDEVEKSIHAYKRVVDLCESKGITSRLSWHYLYVATGYMALDDYDKAVKYYRKSLTATDDLSQDSRANVLANLGICYFRKGKYREALELLDRAEKLYGEHKEPDQKNFSNFANIENWRGDIYDKIGKKKKSLKHYFRALDYAKKGGDFKQISGILKGMADFYAALDDFRNAYDYQVLYDKATEKYLEQINKKKIYELEVKYEAEKKEREAELLRLQATKLQLKALRAQMNPHFMYNALNCIQNYITSNEATNAAKYLAKFAKLMRQSLEYSEMEIISLEKELEFLEDYLYINEKLRFENQMKYKIEVDDEIEEDILGVPTMIVQPYVENAIEHGIRTKKNGFIRVAFSLFDENSILCVVEDNGIGRHRAKQLQENDPSYQNHKSRGTLITEKRLEILHHAKKERGVFVKTIDLTDPTTGEPRGTRVEIQIPIVEIHIK